MNLLVDITAHETTEEAITHVLVERGGQWWTSANQLIEGDVINVRNQDTGLLVKRFVVSEVQSEMD